MPWATCHRPVEPSKDDKIEWQGWKREIKCNKGKGSYLKTLIAIEISIRKFGKER